MQNMKSNILSQRRSIRFSQLFGLLFAMLLLASCNDFLDITPKGRIIAKTGEEYRELLTYEYKYFPSDRAITTVRSDEMTMAPGFTSDLDYSTYFDLWRWNDNTPSTTTTYFGWRRYYHAIYIANYIIEHQKDITKATTAEVEQLVGESYMMRAYCHFLLANLYAEPYTHCNPDTTRGVPLMLKADVNAIPRSSSLKDVYAQVLADITEAERHLNVPDWEKGLNYRFNTVSAQCLRARVCLYMGNWQGALDASKAVIQAHPALEDMTSSSSVLPNRYDSKESIVALETMMDGKYILIGRPAQSLIALYPSGDQRRTKFYHRITSSTSTLLKGGSEQFNCTFRSAEFYLTAAEAAARLGQRTVAIDYLSQLAQKRYNATAYATFQANLSTLTDDQLIEEIINERTRELAFEGHRWYDLRRTTMPALTKTYQGETFQLSANDSRYTMHFPTEAVEANPDIVLWP